MLEEQAHTFVNSNAATLHNVGRDEFEGCVALYYKAEVVFDFVPVLVYAANDELVAYYDEELEWGYIL